MAPHNIDNMETQVVLMEDPALQKQALGPICFEEVAGELTHLLRPP